MDHSSIPLPRLSAEQRHFLLQAMGIQRYCLRSADVEADAGADAGADADAATRSEDKAGRVSSLALPLVASPQRVAVDTGSSGLDLAPAAQTRRGVPMSLMTQVAFQVVLLPADRRLAVCVALPLRPQAVLERSELQLLRNLLRWLGCQLLPDGAERPFSWPLPGLAATDDRHAATALRGFLTQAQQELGFSRLLVLGDAGLDVLEPRLCAADVGWQGWYTRGLADMLANPGLKREVWQQLQSLHAALGG